MKTIWIRALSLLAFMVGLGCGTAFAADAGTSPSSQFNGVLCMIDIADAFQNTSYPGETAADSSNLHCTGSLSNENIMLSCLKQFDPTIAGWPTSDIQTKTFSCTIQGGQCGVAGGLTATSQNLKVGADGSVQLQCTWDASKVP